MAGDRKSPEERQGLAERRRRALFLHAVRGLTQAEIGEVLGVSLRTVARDLQAARKRAMHELQSRADTAEAVTDLAVDIDAALAAVAREAWTAVAASDPTSPQRVRALNTALAATYRRAEVLQGLGLLKRAPAKIELGFDPLGLSETEVQNAIRELRQQLRRGPSSKRGDPDKTAAGA